MIYPALVHKANGIDAQIIWLSGKSNVYRAPVIALKDSPIQNVGDLKGKVLGSGRVGCGWSSPWEIFYQAGIPLDSASKKGAVRFQNISNGAAGVSALLGGKIDASATHPTLVPWAAPVAQGLVKVVGRSPADGIYVNDAGRIALFAMRDFIVKYPQHVQAFLQVKNRTAAWILANPDAAAGIVARETRVPVYIARFAIVDQAQTEFPEGEPSAEAAVRSIRNFQDWYASHGDDILAKKRLDDATLREFVAKPFFQGGQYSAYDSAGKPIAAR
jgi:ABC-type nitrate/sulfonate/bicarbonate transport system substrate-binding protein